MMKRSDWASPAADHLWPSGMTRSLMLRTFNSLNSVLHWFIVGGRCGEWSAWHILPPPSSVVALKWQRHGGIRRVRAQQQVITSPPSITLLIDFQPLFTLEVFLGCIDLHRMHVWPATWGSIPRWKSIIIRARLCVKCWCERLLEEAFSGVLTPQTNIIYRMTAPPVRQPHALLHAEARLWRRGAEAGRQLQRQTLPSG